MKKAFVKKVWGHPVDTQIQRCLDFGIPDKDIWVDGRNKESLPGFLNNLRRGGSDEVYVAADLRVFGQGRKAILGITDQIEEKRIPIRSVLFPEKRFSALLDDALHEIAKYSRKLGGDKTAKKDGRRGGIEKRKAYVQRRDAVAAPGVIERMVNHPKLTWLDCEIILGPPFSVASLRRHYPRTVPTVLTKRKRK